MDWERLLGREETLGVDEAAMIRRARRVPVGSGTARVPGLEDLLLYACIHFGVGPHLAVSQLVHLRRRPYDRCRSGIQLEPISGTGSHDSSGELLLLDAPVGADWDDASSDGRSA